MRIYNFYTHSIQKTREKRVKHFCSTPVLMPLLKTIFPDIIIQSLIAWIPQVSTELKSHIAKKTEKIVVTVLYMVVGRKIHIKSSLNLCNPFCT